MQVYCSTSEASHLSLVPLLTAADCNRSVSALWPSLNSLQIPNGSSIDTDAPHCS